MHKELKTIEEFSTSIPRPSIFMLNKEERVREAMQKEINNRPKPTQEVLEALSMLKAGRTSQIKELSYWMKHWS